MLAKYKMMCLTIALSHTTTEWHTCSLYFVLFCCFSAYLYCTYAFLFFAATSLVNKDLYICFIAVFIAVVRRPTIKEPTIKQKFVLLQFYFTSIAVVRAAL